MAAATTSRLASIRAGTSGPSSARASPRLTSMTSCTVSASPLTITVRMADSLPRAPWSVRCRPAERGREPVPARPGDPDRAPGRPAFYPAQSQQTAGDRRAERPVEVRPALRPVQAGPREAAPRLPDLRHVHSEPGQLLRPVGGDRVRDARALAVPVQDSGPEQGVEQLHPGPPGQVVVAGPGLSQGGRLPRLAQAPHGPDRADLRDRLEDGRHLVPGQPVVAVPALPGHGD